MEELGLAPLTGFAAALAAGTVAGIDALKVYVLRGWAKRVPSIIWYLLAIGIPTAICVYFGLDWFDTLTGGEVPPSLEPVSTTATGIIVGLGASITYKGKETAKALAAANLQADCKPVPEYLTPPGEPGLPAPEPCPPPVPEAGDVSTMPAEENSEATVQPSLPSPAPAPEPVAPPADVGLANSETKVTMFLKLTGVSDATYVLIEDETGQHVYPVSTD